MQFVLKLLNLTFFEMIPYNILVTGADGQLGKSIREVAANTGEKSWNITYCDIDTVDLSDWLAVEAFFKNRHFHVIVNCAAYTAVDKAEEEKEKAFLVNETAVGYLAKIAKRDNSFLIHISTDYVFDGLSNRPYTTEDTTNPISIYGRSKAAGEKNIINSGCHAAIIRTSWLYSDYGHNFVKSILKNGKEKRELRVVNDQWGAPTYAPDLANAILTLVGKSHLHEGVRIYHYANEGVITWFDFAEEIIRFSEIECRVLSICTKEYPTAAKRPAYSVFDLSKIKEELNITIPFWKDSLHEYLQLHTKDKL